MKKIPDLIKKYPVLTYYTMVFAISWGGLLLLAGGKVPGVKEQVDKLFPLVLLALFAGPSVSGIVMNALVYGGAGLRDYFSRLLKWRLDIRWYLAALLTGPVLVSVVLFPLSLISPDYTPGILTNSNKIALLIFGIAWGLIGGGLLEETGWTGFAVPALRKKYSILTTGLIVGVLWGIWHLLVAVWASGSMSGGKLVEFIIGFMSFYLLALPAYRILLVWAYDRTKSLPIVMLMHAALSSSCLILQPISTGAPYYIWNLVLAALIWIVVVSVARITCGELTR